MIIDNKKIKSKALDAISAAKDCRFYRVLPTGELQINNSFKSYVFLAYVRGNWFASYGTRKRASIKIPEEGISLFASGNNSLWLPNDTNVDISVPGIPLDESTHVMLFAFSGNAYDVIIADGSHHSSVVTTCLKKTRENTAFLITTLTSMIRHYDDKAAEEILQFWFQPQTHNDYERRQIQFEKKTDKEEQKGDDSK